MNLHHWLTSPHRQTHTHTLEAAQWCFPRCAALHNKHWRCFDTVLYVPDSQTLTCWSCSFFFCTRLYALSAFKPHIVTVRILILHCTFTLLVIYLNLFSSHYIFLSPFYPGPEKLNFVPTMCHMAEWQIKSLKPWINVTLFQQHSNRSTGRTGHHEHNSCSGLHQHGCTVYTLFAPTFLFRCDQWHKKYTFLIGCQVSCFWREKVNKGAVLSFFCFLWRGLCKRPLVTQQKLFTPNQ